MLVNAQIILKVLLPLWRLLRLALPVRHRCRQTVGGGFRRHPLHPRRLSDGALRPAVQVVQRVLLIVVQLQHIDGLQLLRFLGQAAGGHLVLIKLFRRDNIAALQLRQLLQRGITGHVGKIDLRLCRHAHAGASQPLKLLRDRALFPGRLDALRTKVVGIEVLIADAVGLGGYRPLVHILVVGLEGVLRAEAFPVGLTVGIVRFQSPPQKFLRGCPVCLLHRQRVFLDTGHHGLQLPGLLPLLLVGQLGGLHLPDLLPQVRAGGLLLAPEAADHRRRLIAAVLGIGQFVRLIEEVAAYAVAGYHIRCKRLGKHPPLRLRCQRRQQEVAYHAGILIQYIVEFLR